jgi:dihydroxy-acid dehydratase
MLGHVSPEAARGGPISIVEDGDEITIDTESRRVDVALSEAEIALRLEAWRAPEPRYKMGVMAKYARLVSSASRGAVTC